MGIRIRHRTQCLYCKEWKEPGHAFLQKTRGGWGCQCDRCFNKRNPCKAKGVHQRPVEFNRGKHGHVWACLECGKQLRGPSLPKEELEILIEFAKTLVEAHFTKTEIESKSREGINTVKAEKESTMKLEIAMLVGPEAKGFLVDLTKQLDRMEALTKGSPAKSKAPAAAVEDEDDVDTTAAEEEDEDFAPKKGKGKKAAAAAFDDEEEAGEAEAEEEDEDFTTPAPAAKKAKEKKLTVDDVNDACKARAARTGGKEGRAEVLALLKKHFKTASVSDVKAEDYDKLIKIMKA